MEVFKNAKNKIKRLAAPTIAAATFLAGSGFAPPREPPPVPSMTLPDALIGIALVGGFGWLVGKLADIYLKQRFP